MARALTLGLRRLRSRIGLAFLLLGVNLFFASLLAVPFASTLRRDLENRDASRGMLYGFDTTWWEAWKSSRTGHASSFSPDILGKGFAFKNIDLALRGEFPARLFTSEKPSLDPAILALALGYLFVMTFLSGGVLKALGGEASRLDVKGLLQASGFYFPRLVRVTIVALLLDGVVFFLSGSAEGMLSGVAQRQSSEAWGLALSLSGRALLLLLLLVVHLLSSVAKVLVVAEDRSSALLAFASAVGLCLRSLGQTLVLCLGLLLLAGLGFAVFLAADQALEVTGFKTQILALVLLQAFVLGRILLRLGLLSGLRVIVEGSALV